MHRALLPVQRSGSASPNAALEWPPEDWSAAAETGSDAAPGPMVLPCRRSTNRPQNNAMRVTETPRGE